MIVYVVLYHRDPENPDSHEQFRRVFSSKIKALDYTKGSPFYEIKEEEVV